MKAIKSLILVSLLLFSLLATTLSVEHSFANFIPEQTPAGIVIKDDGSVEGTNLIRYEDGVYKFTGDIHRTIVVLRDNTVIDGAGHRLQGNGKGVGFFLQGRQNVEIRRVTISNFETGIKFTWLFYGSPAVPTKNTVSDNIITNNTYGVALSDSSLCVLLRNNRFLDNTYCLLDNLPNANDIDSSNTVDGKPIYYWVGEHDRTVPSDAGFVVLKNCSGITARNLNLRGNVQGILLYYTNGSTITANSLANNLHGVTLKQSMSNTISGNHIANNKEHGILLDLNSVNNVVSNNRIESNGGDGISIGYYSFSTTPGNTIIQNEIKGNAGNGIAIFNEQDSMVEDNNITLNGVCGIRLGYGTTNLTVRRNYVAKNGLGIQIESPIERFEGGSSGLANGASVPTPPVLIVPKGSLIIENMVIENKGWGIRLNNSQGGNVIHHNNFINNNVTEGLQVSIPAIWIFNVNDVKNPPALAPGKANVWDDGRQGNYWSDYRARYPNASNVGNTGVGDTPYFINENNVDRFPLTSLHEVSAPGNSTLPNQSDEGSVETGLPVEYVFVIASAVVAVGVAASTLLLLRHKKLKAKA